MRNRVSHVTYCGSSIRSFTHKHTETPRCQHTHCGISQKSKNVRVPQISTKDRDKHLLIVNKTFFKKIEYTFKEQIQTTELILV